MLGRIDVIDASAQHGRRPGGEGAVVGRAVDASRQTGDDHMTGLPEVLGQAAGESLARGRGDPRADDGEARPAEQRRIATRPEQGRWRIQRRQ
jgi:hypothetical protein